MISPTHQLTTIHDGVDEIIAPWWYRQAHNFSVEEPHPRRSRTTPACAFPTESEATPNTAKTPLESPEAQVPTQKEKPKHNTKGRHRRIFPTMPSMDHIQTPVAAGTVPSSMRIQPACCPIRALPNQALDNQASVDGVCGASGVFSAVFS